MRKNEDNIIQIGFYSDVDSFVDEIRRKLLAVKDWGVADSLKDEIIDIEKMLSGLSKSFSEGMSSKLDTKSFAAFEKKITAEVNAVTKRVDLLETSLKGLATAFADVDNTGLSKFIESIDSDIGNLKNTVEGSIDVLEKFVDIKAQSNGQVEIVSEAELKNLENEKELLSDIIELQGKIVNDDIVGSISLSSAPNSFNKNLNKITETYQELENTLKEIKKAEKSSDESSLTKLQNKYAKTFMDLRSLMDQMETFGKADSIPDSIYEGMQNGVDYIDELAKRAQMRLEDLEKISNKSVAKSFIPYDKSKNVFSTPIEISTTGRGLAAQARRIIESAQNQLKDEPLKINFALTSKYSSKKTNALLVEWQKQINSIEDTDLRGKFEDLYSTIAKDFQKELKLTVTPDVENASDKVKEVIAGIKKELQEKIHIFPKFDIQDVDIAELQTKLDAIASKLTFRLSNIELDKKPSDEELNALAALSKTLEKRLDSLDKTYLAPIKRSLLDIVRLAKQINTVSDQADAPINAIIESVKELTTVFQKAFGILSKEDLDSLFENMRASIVGIKGDLRGGDKNKLVLQLKEIIGLYKQYKDMGGTSELSDLGGEKNVQKWLSKHANDQIESSNPYVEEGKNGAAGYAEGIRAGIPGVKEAAKELVEAALETIRDTQDSNSPAKKSIPLGEDLADGYIKGFRNKIRELKSAASEETDDTINEVLKKNAEEFNKAFAKMQKQTDKINKIQTSLEKKVQEITAANNEKFGLDKIDLGEANVVASSMKEIANETAEAGSKFKEYSEDVALGLERIERAKVLGKAGLLYDEDLGDPNSLYHVAYDLVGVSDELWKEVVDKGLVEEGTRKYNEIRAFLQQYIKNFLSKFNLTVDEIKNQLSEIANINPSEVGFKPHRKIGNAGGGWQYYHSTWKNGHSSDQFQGDYQYKTYARFADPRQLNQANITAIMKALSSAGFRGQLKVPGMAGVDRFAASSDQLVIHGINSKMQKIAYEILNDQFSKLFSSLKAGFDKSANESFDGASFSQIVINKERDSLLGEAKELLESQQGQIQSVQKNIDTTKEQEAANEELSKSQKIATDATKKEAASMQELEKQLRAIFNKGHYSSADISELLGLNEDTVNRKVLELEFGGATKDQKVDEFMKLYKIFQNEPPIHEKTQAEIDAQFQKLCDILEETEKQSKKTKKELEEVSSIPSKGIEKQIENYEILNKEQQKVEETSAKSKGRRKKKTQMPTTVPSTEGSSDEIKKAADAIEKEGKAASKAKKKKEGFAKANEKVAEASKKTADATKDAADAIEKEQKKAEKARESVLQSEHGTRRKIEKEEEKNNENALKERQKVFRNYAKKNEDELISILKGLDGAKFSKKFIDPFQQQIDELRNKIKDLFSSDLANINYEEIKNATKEYEELSRSLNNKDFARSVTIFDNEERISNMKRKIQDFMENNSAMSDKYKQKLRDLIQMLGKVDDLTEEDFRNIKTSFNDIAYEIGEVHQKGLSFTDSFAKQLKSANAQLLATYFSFQDFIRYLREGLQTVVEVDSALTELRKVSDATDKRLSQSFKESAKTAKELGDTISNVIGVTADWARLGYSVDDAEKLAKVTTLFRTVGDNMTSEDSSSYLISTLKGFGKAADEAESIVDVYNEVANNWAIDTAGIGEALQRSAASFYAANTDLEKAVALITATNTVVQDPTSVGTLWKTLSARIRGAKTELAELDEEEDEFTETTSKLRDLVKGLTGFDILESDLKTYKDIYEIILGIGEKWQDLSDIEQASLAEALAGKRNSNALLAVLNNLDTLQGAYKSALEAEGSARKEQENYARSIQYSIDRLKAVGQEFWTTLINSKSAKLVIDFLTKTIELLTELTRITSGAPVMGLGIIVALFGKDPVKFMHSARGFLDGIGKQFGYLTLEIDKAGEVTKRTYDYFKLLKVAAKAVVAALIITAVIKTWEHLNVTVAETQKKIDSINGKISELKGEIEKIESIDFASRTDEQKERLKNLRDELGIQEKLLEIAKQRNAAESITRENDSLIKKYTDAFDKENYSTYLRDFAKKSFIKDELFAPETYKNNAEKYEKYTNLIRKYQEEQKNYKNGSKEWLSLNNKIASTEEKRNKVQSKLNAKYQEEAENFYEIEQKIEEIKTLRDSLAKDNPLREELDDLIKKYTPWLERIRTILISLGKFLGKDISSFTIDSRLAEANSKIAKGSKKDHEALEEEIKYFSLEEKEAWIIATQGAKNATEAIEMYKASLEKTQEEIAKGVEPKFDQAKFSEQVNELDALQSAYNTFVQNVENKEPKINLDISDIESMREVFGKLEGFDKFELIVTSDTSDADKIQAAFDKLLTSYATQKINLDQISEKNKDMIRTQLEMEGATHESAQAYVDAALKMKQAQDLLAASGKDLTTVTGSQITAMVKLGEITPEVGKQLALLALKEQLINNNSISTASSIQNLYNLGLQAGMTRAELEALKEIMDLINSAKAVKATAEKTGSGYAYQASNEMFKAAEKKWENFGEIVQEKLEKTSKSLTFDYGKAASDASKGGGDAGDAYVEAYEKELAQLESLRDRGLISEKEYLNRLKTLIDKYFKDRAKYAEKYAEELKKYMDQMLSYYNSVISGVTTLLDKRINALQKNKDITIDALNKEKDAAQERYQAEIDGIQDELDALEDRQDALDDQQKALDEQIDALNEQIGGIDKEIDRYHDMIDAINEANDARQREINLQKAQYELERAQNQRTKLVYTGEVGQMRYERDESTVRDTQENVRQAKDQIAIAALEKKIDLLEKEKERIEEEIDVIEKQKDAIDKQKDALNEQSKDLQKQQEEVQKAMESSSRYYEKLIKKQEEFFDSQIAALEKTKTKWEELAEIDEISKAWGLVSDEMTSLGFTVEDVLNDVPGAFDAFKEQYIAVLQEMHKGDQGYLDGLKENASAIPTEYGKVTQSVTEAKGPIDNLSSSVSTASSNVSTLGTSASTASTSVNNLKTASQGIADNFVALNEVSSLENLNDALKLVEESLINIKTLIGGMGDPGTGSLYGAIGALNTLTLDNLKSAFEQLAGAVGGVISALTGSVVGSSGGSTTLFKKYTTNTTAASMVGGGLISGIQAVKDKTDDVIGTSAEEDGANAIGSFRELLKAIENVVDQIGVDKEKKGTLLYSIGLISKVTQNEINGSGGAVSAFNDLQSKIGSVKNAANSLLSVLNEISSVELPDPSSHMSSSGNQHGGSSGSWGKSKAQGDPNVKTNGRSLVGELGPEVVVRGDKYKVVGVDGPEFVNLKKGDIVLNSKDTEELFDKKNLHGKAFAEGSKFTPFNLSDSYKGLLDKVNTMDFPTMREIKSSIDNLTRTVQSEIQNVTTTRTKVTQNNTFNISGVTGEEVAEKINNTLVKTFSGMSLNAYQRSMA